MDAPTPTRRWWHSYEWNVLAALGIIAVLVLGWLVWQASIVRHRLEMRWQIHADGGALFMRRGLIDSGPDVAGGSGAQIDALGPGAIGQIRPEEPGRGVSKIRLLLGDEEIKHIWFWRRLTPADRAAIEAFPEADIEGVR